MRGARRVIIVDAASTGSRREPSSGCRARNWRVARRRRRSTPIGSAGTRCCPSVDWLLGDDYPDEVTVFLIEIAQTDHGAPLSDVVAEAMDRVQAMHHNRMGRGRVMSTLVSEDLRVTGIVQGVGFRPFVYRLAAALGLSGEVGNSATEVFISVAGAAPAVDEFIDAAPHRCAAPRPASMRSGEARGVAAQRSHSRAATVRSRSSTVARTADHERSSRPTRRCAIDVSPNCSTPPTGGSATRSSPAPTAGLGSRSSPACPTTGRRPPWPASPCARRATRSTPTRSTVATTPSRSPAGRAAPRSSTTDRRADGGRRSDPAGRRRSDERRDRRHQGGRRLPPGVRRHQRCRRAASCGGASTGPTSRSRSWSPTSSGARRLARIDIGEADLLLRARPSDRARCSSGRHPSFRPRVAPGNPLIGVMLPYTPIHHLLFAGQRHRVPLVMTSGNLGGEPIVLPRRRRPATRSARSPTDSSTHDRPIHVPCDDSVVRVVDGRLPARSAESRGYAPLPVALRSPSARDRSGGRRRAQEHLLPGRRRPRLGQPAHRRHGEPRDAAGVRGLGDEPFVDLYHVEPDVVAADAHPGYAAVPVGPAARWPRRSIEVQHHHAHRRLGDGRARARSRHRGDRGSSFDGTGYGADGTIWGGEVLVAERPLVPAGRMARARPAARAATAPSHHPCRMALAHLYAAGVSLVRRSAAGPGDSTPTNATSCATSSTGGSTACRPRAWVASSTPSPRSWVCATRSPTRPRRRSSSRTSPPAGTSQPVRLTFDLAR